MIDPIGLDSIYVIDQAERPADNGVDENTYTATIYVVQNGEVKEETYEGSSYPNSTSATDNSTPWNTIDEGEHKFHNENGHTPASTGVTQKGLNIDDDTNPNTRTTDGKKPDGTDTQMSNVNVHKGCSNNGNYSSRGSHGCITIKPSDSSNFFSNFDWSGSNGVTGNSSGSIFIYRGTGSDVKNMLDSKIEWNKNPMVKMSSKPAVVAN